MKKYPIMICEIKSGECVSVDKIDRSSVKAIQKWVSRTIQWYPESEFKILSGSKEVRKFFKNYFQRIKKYKIERQALLFAEKYGITEYRVRGFKMYWKELHYGEGTYKVTLNLKTMKEDRRLLKSGRKTS